MRYAGDAVPETPKRLSMLRSYTPADGLTLANASCGTISLFLCLAYIDDQRSSQLWAAFVLPLAALVFDVADGYVARLHPRRKSAIGGDLDSLADVVSFGVAPAVLGYTLGLRGLWDVVCLTWFVCCGISRLARFNATAADLTNAATGKVRYFEGTPIPTSVLIVMMLAALYRFDMTGPDLWLGHWRVAERIFHPLSIIYVISGSLMISTIRIPKP
jgi:CDP-diacylglycerol--serine O-phosphatidyltransferase